MLARTAFALLALALTSAAGACSASPDSAKKPLPVCDANDAECPGVPTAPSKQHTDIPTDPVHVPDEPTPDTKTDPSPSADAGHDGADAAPVVGKQCQELGACCKQLGDAGYSTDTCKSVLSTNNEDACYTQHASYEMYGDCN